MTVSRNDVASFYDTNTPQKRPLSWPAHDSTHDSHMDRKHDTAN